MDREEHLRIERRRKDDIANSIIARRESSDILSQANDMIKRVQRNLKYSKGNDVSLKLFRLIQEIDEIRVILQDPESDPD